MRTTGWLCILAALLLFLAAFNTVYIWNFSADGIAAHAQSPQQIPWQLEAGIELLSGAAFLLPGFGMLTPFGIHRRRRSSHRHSHS